MSAHTPGPWWVTESGVRDRRGYIAFIPDTTHWPDQHERYAKEVLERKNNARLIAAAPDLLEALRICLTHGSMTCDDWVIEKAERAIEEATGAPA